MRAWGRTTSTAKSALEKWGLYLSERQWKTMREDYSDGGNAWDYFPHDHARSRVYRCDEDGIAGISDDMQCICFAVNPFDESFDTLFIQRIHEADEFYNTISH